MIEDLIHNCPVHGEFCIDCGKLVKPCFQLCPECTGITEGELLDDAIYEYCRESLFKVIGFKNIPFQILDKRFDYIVVGKK